MNILIKNWLDMCIGAMVYWAVGFAITFGKSRPGIAYFMGTSYYFFYEMPREAQKFYILQEDKRLHEGEEKLNTTS